MSSDTPIWLMDVDGVLNAFNTPKIHDNMIHFRSANGYDIVYYPEILERIASLHTEGRVEVRWLTTWEESADEFLAEQLGMPRGLAVQGKMPEGYMMRRRVEWWKLDEAQKLVQDGERVIWTDDEITERQNSHDWVREVDAKQLLAFAPDTTTGLTHEFLDTVEAWL